MNVINIIVKIISGTPLYVWILFIFLLKRGLNSAKDGEISFPKMFIVPLIFMIWGLEKLFTSFSYLNIAMIFYIIFMFFGLSISYFLYSRYRKLYIKDNSLYKTGTYLPLIFVIVNFLVKYILNVAIIINPSLYNTLYFSILYSLLCGFSVGLFIGGILQAYIAYSQLKTVV